MNKYDIEVKIGNKLGAKRKIVVCVSRNLKQSR